jgi:hypothetical protein
MAEKIRLLLLDDERTQQMLRRPDIIQAFPIMRGFAEKLANAISSDDKCSPCSSKTKAFDTQDYSLLRSIIDRFTQPEKQQLLFLLNAEAIRFYYLDQAGNRVKATIVGA